MSITTGSISSKYTLDQVVGSGSYGKVYSLKPTPDGRILCCKRIMYSEMSRKAKELVNAEIQITMQLSHENIVRYYEVFEDTNERSYSIVMDYYKNGDMLDFLRSHQRSKKRIDEDLLWAVMIQVLLALEYCHSPFNPTGRSIIHRDIKPANLLVGNDMQIKLADFGVCRLYENSQENRAMTIVGTPVYMPPESLEKGAYTTAFDIWSLGCTMYELAVQKYLIAGSSDRERLQCAEAVSRRLLTIPHYSPIFSRIVSSMVRYDPTERPTATELLQSPEIQKIMQQWEKTGRFGHITTGHSVGIAATAVTVNFFNNSDMKPAQRDQDVENQAIPVPIQQQAATPPASVNGIKVNRADLKQLPAGDPDDLILKSSTPLMNAVKANNIDEIKSYLDEHGKKQRMDGMTALMLAAVANNVEAGMLLLEKEKGIRSLSGFTALLYAIENKNKEFAKLMLPHEKHLTIKNLALKDALSCMHMEELIAYL